MRTVVTWLAGAWLPLALGCAWPDGAKIETPGSVPPPPSGDINRMSLEANPVAVNWDGRPGPDGLTVRVHFFAPSSKLPAAAPGLMEFVLYEGRMTADEDLSKAVPFYTWKIPPEALRANVVRSQYGWGYVLRLGWGSTPPATGTVTLIGIYRPPAGAPVTANPLVVSVVPP